MRLRRKCGSWWKRLGESDGCRCVGLRSEVFASLRMTNLFLILIFQRTQITITVWSLRTWGAAVLRPYTSMPRLSDRDYLEETSTEALVFSQDMLRVQPEEAWSKAMVKFSIGEESLETFMSMRARSLLGPG